MSINDVKGIQQQPFVNNNASKQVVQNQSKTIGKELTKKSELEQIKEKYNLSEEQVRNILKNYPAFLSLPETEKLKIVQNLPQPAVQTDDVQEETEQYNIENTGDGVNFKEFSQKSAKEQFNDYASELAKNKFLYGGENKTVQDWEALSDEQRLQLIDAEKSGLTKSSDKYAGMEEKYVKSYFQAKMETLQTTNANEMSLEEFNALSEEEQAELKHDYIFSLDEDSLSESQNKYLKEQALISAAVVEACRQNGEDWGNGTYILNTYELKEHCKHLGKSLIEVEYDYLQSKADKGALTDEDEQKRFEGLKAIINTDAGQRILASVNNPQTYGIMDDLKASNFGEDWQNVQTASTEDKMMVLGNYVKDKFKNLSPDEKADFLSKLTSELALDDPMLANDLAGLQLKKMSHKDRMAMINSDTGLGQELVAINNNVFDKDEHLALAAHQKVVYKHNPDRATALATTVLNTANEEGLLATSDIYSGFGDKVVEDAHANAALNKNRVGAEGQIIMLNNTAANSNSKTKISTAIRLDEAYTGNQLPLTETFIQDQDCNEEMIKDGTLTRFADENQVAAFKMHKTRCEQPDYDKEDAINSLNTLSDWISECKNPDNQLAMHNEIMTSKYSEVQEHAAGNIKNYDPSVQTQAMDAVYKSGNQKAIETAVNNLISSKSSDVIAQECIRYIGEEALKAAVKDDLNQKFLAGNLTTQELNQLSVSERREYISAYFKKLPLDQKIKLLSSISNSSIKKTIYTMIARSDSHLFNEICKDKDRADRLLSLGLPVDVNNKIHGIVSFLAVSDIGFQGIAKKFGIEYDGMKEQEPRTARTLTNFASAPFSTDIKGLEFFRKQDKLGRMYING